MSTPTSGHEQYLTQLEEEMSSKFKEPKYKNYRLIYTTDPDKADVKISKNHTALDYLAIGFVALSKQSKEDTPIILAIHDDTMGNNQDPYCHVFIDETSPAHPLPHNALVEIYQNIDTVVITYLSHPGFSPWGIGLGLPPYFTSLQMGYFKNPDIIFDFEDFNDVLFAQKLAFSNLKKYTISSYLGSLETFITGSD